MNQIRSTKKQANSIIAVILLLVLLLVVSLSVLFSRVVPYTRAEFPNVHSLLENEVFETPISETEVTIIETDDKDHIGNPKFEMDFEADIFKTYYDETGKTTVDTSDGDNLIAPGTGNVYQFTLANTGDVALDYTMQVEAWVEGTDLWLPVNARMWDHTNRYLLGSADAMPDVLELDGITDSAELGAGRNAIYNIEWEWPFEREVVSEEDQYDTMLGDLAVTDDLELHIRIRTYAEYDEKPDDPDAGLYNPPNTGDESQLALLIVLCIGSFIGICVMLFAFFKSGRKEEEQQAE